MAKKKIDYNLARQIANHAILQEKIDKNDKKVINIKLEQLLENPYQPRLNIDESKLQELADSIEKNGLMQPIVITNTENTANTYTIIAGHRRVLALKLLNKENIEAIILKKVAHEQLAILPLVENLQREDMEPIESALGFKKILDNKIVKNQDSLAKKIGVSKSWLSRLLSILKLPEDLIVKIKEVGYKDVNVLSTLNKLSPDESSKVFDLIKDKTRSEAIEFIKNYKKNDKPQNISPVKINKNKVTINLKDVDENKKIKVEKLVDEIRKILD